MHELEIQMPENHANQHKNAVWSGLVQSAHSFENWPDVSTYWVLWFLLGPDGELLLPLNLSQTV